MKKKRKTLWVTSRRSGFNLWKNKPYFDYYGFYTTSFPYELEIDPPKHIHEAWKKVLKGNSCFEVDAETWMPVKKEQSK